MSLICLADPVPDEAHTAITRLPDTMTSADARFMAMQAHILGKTERVQHWRTIAAELQLLEKNEARTHLPDKEDRFAMSASANGEEREASNQQHYLCNAA